MPEKPRDPYLLTPGPLTTSANVKAAMLHDWGSRDHAFVATNRRLRERLIALAGAEATHLCVPQQGPCDVLSWPVPYCNRRKRQLDSSTTH